MILGFFLEFLNNSTYRLGVNIIVRYFMKNKLFLAIMFALSGSLVQAADQVGKENGVAQGKSAGASPLTDITRWFANRMKQENQQGEPAAQQIRGGANPTSEIVRNEIVFGLK